MKRAGGFLALLVGLSTVASLPAQKPIVPMPVIGKPVNAGLRFSAPGRRSSFSVYFGLSGPVCYPPLWGGGGYWGRSFTNITIVTPPVVAPIPIVIAPPADPVLRDPVIVDPVIIRPRNRQPKEEPPPPPAGDPFADRPEKPLPGGAPAGGFRPIRPEDRARAQMPAQPAQPAPKPEEPPPAPPREPAPPAPMQPDPDPKNEFNRLLILGRDSFANQEYGRAVRRFRQATEVQPAEPVGHFLLAQAEFAVGKYREAVAAIHTGLRLEPNWPAMGFRPLDLYGANVADYPDHLKALETTLANHADDPVLLFLYAYQLWFDGRHDEARPRFRRAAGLVADPSFIRLFLRDDPAAPVV
jgi:hypothetical protein